MYTKESFSSNAELTKYALDKYGLELDGRSSMDKLLNELNEAQSKQPGLQVPDKEIPKKDETNPDSAVDEQPEKPKEVTFGNDPVGKGLALLQKRRNK
ncbi:hypothetical protein [Vibrio harveyi]|uniref:hypothetical protein n=1 Tax=Vibrio harveyi TaxID=669 RepID=UPI00068034E7|nr:hypothetical protein [Vibrio harveyi]